MLMASDNEKCDGQSGKNGHSGLRGHTKEQNIYHTGGG